MKKFLVALCALAGFSFGSMIGMEALGEEQVQGGTASAAGRGFAGNAKTGDAEGLSVVNPARFAFDTKVVFNLNIAMEMIPDVGLGNDGCLPVAALCFFLEGRLFL